MSLLFVVCTFALVAAQNYDEAFTIFIDLDDFHLTQADSHEFLDHQEIGEHNNVILHLTEDQVKHHMNKHDTHDCHHPEEIHEVVSFIQENMYERPNSNSVDLAIDQVIDQALGSNYAGWDSMKQNPMALSPMGMPQIPMGMPQMQVPVTNIQAPAAVQKSANQVSDEEEAAARFRDAYRAYKSFSHAFQGDSNTKSQANPFSSIFGSLMDDSDKKILSLLQNQYPNTKPANDIYSAAMEGSFSDVLGHAYDNVVAPSTTESDHHHRHHHHHHRHHDDEEQQQQEQSQVSSNESVQETENNQPQVQTVKVQQQQQQPQQQQQQVLSTQEKDAIRNLVSIVLGKKDQGALSHEIQEIVDEVKSEKNNASPMVASDVDEKTASAINNNKSIPSTPASSRPSAPLMTSHIEKVGPLTDLIPDSVYAKQNVPFTEPQASKKHVAKRILIPRMEEPGPVIGGGSRPLHIQLPPMDDDIKIGSTRPSAPAQVQIQSASSITAAAETQAVGSSKSSSLASANDEALSAPEVVIF